QDLGYTHEDRAHERAVLRSGCLILRRVARAAVDGQHDPRARPLDVGDGMLQAAEVDGLDLHLARQPDLGDPDRSDPEIGQRRLKRLRVSSPLDLVLVDPDQEPRLAPGPRSGKRRHRDDRDQKATECQLVTHGTAPDALIREGYRALQAWLADSH